MKFISLRTLRSMCLDFIIFLVPAALLFFSLPYLFRLFMPFIVGFFLYFLSSPLNRFLLKNRAPKSVSAFLSLFTISAAAFFSIRFVSLKLWIQLRTLIQSIAENPDDAFWSITKKISSGLEAVSGYIRPATAAGDVFSGVSGAFLQSVTDFVTEISASLLNTAKNIPSILLCTVIAFFTAFFLLKENSSVFSFCRSFFGEKASDWFLRVKKTFFDIFKKYLKAQLIIEIIIFFILLTGFLFLRLKYAFLFAFIIALIDAVPLFGTGTVLLPAALYNFILGNSLLGWGLVAIYGSVLLTRQLCEPKIIGKNLGIHPLISVFSIYLGLKLFGVLGLFFGPLSAIFIKNLIFPE